MATSKDARTDESGGFSDQERAAMKERAAELKSARRGTKDREPELLARIAEMPDPDRAIAQRVHELVKEHAPGLAAKTWYGMPAWASGDKVLVFFQGAAKFDSRYATLGFNDVASLDDGAMWPTTFAIVELTPEVEATIVDLLTRATS